MNIVIYLGLAVVAYLLGSIPFGLILVRMVRGEDVRLTGSGNIGATNVARSGGAKLGIATLILDALKGYLAVFIASVADKYGDNGKVIVSIVRKEAPGTAELDTFLMSCRVLGRFVVIEPCHGIPGGADRVQYRFAPQHGHPSLR